MTQSRPDPDFVHRDLMIMRDSDKEGFWRWRTAHYVVYCRQPDGSRVEVFSGRFRNHQEAARAARRFLAKQGSPRP